MPVPERHADTSTSVRHVHHYNGIPYFQSVCSCGQSGGLATYWHVANEDSRDHQRAVYERQRSAS